MTPAEAARALREELEATLADLAGARMPLKVRSVQPPQDLGADRCFRIRLRTADSQDIDLELPTTLALGYLADEEAAVDEWRIWVADTLRWITTEASGEG